MLLQKQVYSIFKVIFTDNRHKIVIKQRLVHIILEAVRHEALKQMTAFLMQIIITSYTVICIRMPTLR